MNLSLLQWWLRGALPHTQIMGIWVCVLFFPRSRRCERILPLHWSSSPQPLLQQVTSLWFSSSASGLMTEEIVLPGCKTVQDNCLAHTVQMKALLALAGASLLWSARCWKLSPYPAKCFKAAGLLGVFGTERQKVKLIHGHIIHVHHTYNLKWEFITSFFSWLRVMHQNKPNVKWGSWQLDGSIANKAADASSLKCWGFLISQRHLSCLILKKMKLKLFPSITDQFNNKTRHELPVFSSRAFCQIKRLNLGSA